MDIKTIKNDVNDGELKPFINGYDRGYSDGNKKGKFKGIIIGGILGFISACVLEIFLNRDEIHEEYKKEHPEEFNE